MLLNDNSNYPFVLLLKLAVYFRVVVQRFSPNSHTRAGLLCKVFTPRLQSAHILVAPENTPFMPASVIDEDFVHETLVSAIDSGEFKEFGVLTQVASLMKQTSHLFPLEAHALKCSFTLPWRNVKSKGSLDKVQVYLNQLLGDAATRKQVSSYKPFSASIVAQILDRSIPVFTEHADSFIEIFTTYHYTSPQASKGYFQSNDIQIFHNYKEAMTTVVRKHRGAIQACFPHIGEFYVESRTNSGLNWLNALHYSCVAAAVWVILFTTGLRNIDIRKSLLKDCVVDVEESALKHYLITDIQKVSIFNHPIPIPPITVKAIEFLKNINFSPIPQLVAKLRVDERYTGWHFSSGDLLNKYLREVAVGWGLNLLDELEEDDRHEGVAHRCRVTLAGFIAMNSPLAVMVLRRLYAHTNNVMPDHYIRHIKSVTEERRRIEHITYDEMSSDISDGIVSGKFSGGMKEKVVADVKDLKAKITSENKSLTQGEVDTTLRENIKSVLLERLKNGESLGLMTPLGVVCMRNPSSTQPAPCAGKLQNAKLSEANNDKRVIRAIQAAMLPDLDNCQGPNCKHSIIFDNPTTKLLLDTFHYYVNYLKNVGKFHIEHLDEEAKNFVSLYYPALKDVYPEIDFNPQEVL